MIKLNASYSKKVPAEQEYSSKSFMACVEVELPAGADPAELKSRIHETFSLVRASVEEEIAGTAANGRERAKRRSPDRSGPRIPASNKQVRYILDLGKARDMTLAALNDEAKHLYGVESIYNLSKPDASRFVDHLKQAA